MRDVAFGFSLSPAHQRFALLGALLWRELLSMSHRLGRHADVRLVIFHVVPVRRNVANRAYVDGGGDQNGAVTFYTRSSDTPEQRYQPDSTERDS